MLAWWFALPEDIRQCWQVEETHCFWHKKDGQAWVHHSRSGKCFSRSRGTSNMPAGSWMSMEQLGLLHRSSSRENFLCYSSTYRGGPVNSCSSLSMLIKSLRPVADIRRVSAAPRACYTKTIRQWGIKPEISEGWVWEAAQLVERQGKQMRGLSLWELQHLRWSKFHQSEADLQATRYSGRNCLIKYFPPFLPPKSCWGCC